MLRTFACHSCRTQHRTSLTHVGSQTIEEWWQSRGSLCKVCYGRAQGVTLRNQGMAQAVANGSTQYKSDYRAEFLRLLASGQEFCSDDITRVVGIPPSPNLIGGLFNGLLREHKNSIQSVGMRQMERPGAHARRTLTYQRTNN